jgi:serine/threonine protein kinase
MNDVFEQTDFSLSLSDLHATIRMAEPPGSAAERSDLIDSAYEEYCQRVETGEPVDAEEFCSRFPAFQTSLRRLLRAHQNLEDNPEILNDLTARWPEPGESFLGFRLLSELGRGAFARVFLAQEVAVGGRLVAVKLSLHDDHEADTLGRLQHPNIVSIFSTQRDSATGFSTVCMPFLGGTTLCHVIDQARALQGHGKRADVLLSAARDGRWPNENAAPPHSSLSRGTYIDGVLHLVERLANALHYVHAQGIIHRDLKPSNVLVCPNGVPVLLDFNLALDREVTDYRLGGTLPYMPPEQLQAIVHRRAYRPSSADARTDLYGLGVILYELLAGAHPFGPVPAKLSTLQARDWLLARQKQGPRPIKELNPAVDPLLASFAMRCIANEVRLRPASAEEILSELRRFQSPRLRARRWARNNWKTLTVASVLALVPMGAASHYLLTLPPAAVRNANAGRELAKEGEWHHAIKAFTNSLDADEQQPAVRFERGRAYMMVGAWEKATNDFEKADPDHTDGKTQACLAFCYAARGEHELAITSGKMALDLGFESATIQNNRAFSFWKRARYGEAIDAANRALDQHAGLSESLMIRGMARRELAKPPKSDAGLARLAFQDLQAALTGGLNSNEAYRKAALAGATVLEIEGFDPAVDRTVLDYVRKALECGASREFIANEPILKSFVKRLGNGIQSVPTPPSPMEGLVDPLFVQRQAN